MALFSDDMDDGLLPYVLQDDEGGGLYPLYYPIVPDSSHGEPSTYTTLSIT